MASLAAGYNAAMEAWRDPSSVGGQDSTDYGDFYGQLWAYYLDRSDIVYSSARLQQLNSRGRALYKHTRLIFNPVPQVVDFYVDYLYPHAPEMLPSGLALATPLMDGTDEGIKEAVAQIDQWTNWLSEALRMVRFGGSTGSVGVEIVDELEREKVTHRILWPSLVKSVTLDAANNVKAYTLEYKVWDDEKKENYTYRKEVDDEFFQYFRDDKSFDPPEKENDTEARIETGVYKNPYGFVPMVWVKFKDDGSERGLPAVVNTDKIDDFNSLVSHRVDHQHKAIEAGKLISTSGEILSVTGAVGASRKGESGGIHPYDTRNDWMLLKAPEGSEVHNLGSSFDLTLGDPEVVRILESFVTDYPELQAAKLIQEHSATAGIALKYKLGKAQSRLDQAGAQFNNQVIKLKQMSVAMAGWRANGNGWTKKDAQQQRFSPFNLDSYADGKLDFGMKRSLLVHTTEEEEVDLQGKRLENAVKAGEVGYDADSQLKFAGESDEQERARILKLRATINPVIDNEQ